MQKFYSIIKIVVVNTFVFLAFLVLSNYLLGVYLRSSKASRADLPNYSKDYQLGIKIFKEYARIGHDYAPYMGWKTLPFTGETLSIGQDGFRLVPGSKSGLSSESITVGFFGGSTLWGEGSPDESTIPSLFARANPDYIVYNYGQLAFNSRQNLAVLANLYSIGEKLDIVIFYDGVNDAAFLCPEQVSVPGHRMEPVFRERLYVNNKYLVRKALFKYSLQNILIFTNGIREKYFGQEIKSEYQCYNDEEKINSIADGMLNNWRLAEQITTSNGGKFIGVLQPMAYRGNPKIDHLENLDKELGRSMNMVYDRILEQMDSSYTTQSFNLLDAFNQKEYIYIDFCHVSPNGNKIIASKITEFVAQQNYFSPQ